MRAPAIALILFFSCLAIPRSAVAQGIRPGEVAGGWADLQDYFVDENFPASWFASGAWHIKPSLAAVGELGGSYKTYEFSVNPTTEDHTASTTDASTTTSIHTLLGGVRYTARRRIFVQFLAGPAWEQGGVAVFRETVSSNDPKFALQPGGGIDVPLNARLSARLGADYRIIFAGRENSESKNNSQFRFIAGLVAGF